jgi:hypothetical protein
MLLNKLYPKLPSLECWCSPYFPWKIFMLIKNVNRYLTAQAFFIIIWKWQTLPSAHQSIRSFSRNWGMRLLVVVGWNKSKYHTLSVINVSRIPWWKYYILKHTGSKMSGPIVTQLLSLEIF